MRPNPDVPILIVDDDENVRTLIAEILSDEGLTFVMARDGQEVIEQRLGGEPVSLVITDLMMAGGDGLDLVHELGRLRPGLPVIIMSALMDESEIVREVEDEPNVIGWVRKPLDLDRLRELVHQSLERRAP